jgi:hypothetical protein
VEQHANNPIEADQGGLKARLRPMRGLKATVPRGPWSPGMPSSRTSAAAITKLATDVPGHHRIRTACDQLTLAT